MKSFFIWSVMLVLSCVGVGCSKFHRKPIPQQAQAPTLSTAPVQAPPQLADPVPSLPEDTTEQTVVLGTAEPTPKPKKTYVAKKPSKQIVTDDSGTKPAPSTEAASDGTAGAPSPIGQLSANDSTDNPALRQQTTDLIASTEKRLKTVDTNLAATKHDTMVQIASFLKQAKQALEINDLQGANTLATKAKILVDELLK